MVHVLQASGGERPPVARVGALEVDDESWLTGRLAPVSSS
jgi:hypothetical protein